MKGYKLGKGSSFAEFYYVGLTIDGSENLAEYIQINKWYFDKMKPEIKEQFRRLYRIYKEQEEKIGKENQSS